ncbi:unnamed protein product, partial [Ectocarpus sp. 13 AM-2016]
HKCRWYTQDTGQSKQHAASRSGLQPPLLLRNFGDTAERYKRFWKGFSLLTDVVVCCHFLCLEGPSQASDVGGWSSATFCLDLGTHTQKHGFGKCVNPLH